LRRGETGAPGEKLLGARTRTNNKLNPHMAQRPEVKPGPQWWEASVLTTAPLVEWSSAVMADRRVKKV